MRTSTRARLRAAAAACGLFVLASAGWSGDSAGPVLVDGSKGVDRVNIGSYETRGDGTLVWPRRYFGISAPMDWSSYDFVEFTLL